MKTITTKQAVEAYGVIEKAKTTKLSDKEQVDMVRMVCRLRPVVTAYRENLQEASKRLAPENMEEIVRKEQAGEERTAEELAGVEAYNKGMMSFMEEEMAREVTLDCALLSEVGVARLKASNPEWTMGDLLPVMDALMESAPAKADDAKTEEG